MKFKVLTNFKLDKTHVTKDSIVELDEAAAKPYLDAKVLVAEVSEVQEVVPQKEVEQVQEPKVESKKQNKKGK